MTPSIQNALNEVCKTILSFVVEHSTIDQREREMLKLYFFENIDLDRLAATYELSSERVRQLILRALRRIKAETKRIESEYIDLKNTSYNFDCLSAENTYLRKSMIEIATISATQVERFNKCHKEYISTNGVFGKKLVDFDLSVRALNCLKVANIETVGQLIRFRRTDLLKFRNFGKASLKELSDFLASLGLSFIE